MNLWLEIHKNPELRQDIIAFFSHAQAMSSAASQSGSRNGNFFEAGTFCSSLPFFGGAALAMGGRGIRRNRINRFELTPVEWTDVLR